MEEIGLIPSISLVASLLAVWLAWLAYRVMATCWIKIIEAKCLPRLIIDGVKVRSYSELQIAIRNCGVALHDVRVCLEVNAGPTCPPAVLELARGSFECESHQLGRRGVFATGMYGLFKIRTIDLHSNDFGTTHFRSMYEKETDGNPKRLRLKIFSQGYLVKSIPIPGRIRACKGWWNGFARPINRNTGANIATFVDLDCEVDKLMSTVEREAPWRTDEVELTSV